MLPNVARSSGRAHVAPGGPGECPGPNRPDCLAADNFRSRKCGAGHGEVFGFTGAAGRRQLAVMVRGQRVG